MGFIGLRGPLDYYSKHLSTFAISPFLEGWLNSYHGKVGESLFLLFFQIPVKEGTWKD